MDQTARKLMTMHKVLHPRDEEDRLYFSRKQEGRGFSIIADSVDTSIPRHNEKKTTYKKQMKTNYRHQKQYLDKANIKRKQKWKEKMYGNFMQHTSEISHEKNWI